MSTESFLVTMIACS